VTSRSLCALALVGLGSCTGVPDQPAPGEPWQGELASYVLDRGGQSEIEHRLRVGDGTARRLIFAEAPALAPGSRLRVWGEPEGEALRVRRFEVDDVPVEARASALIAGQKKPLRRWAFVLLDIDGGGNPIDKTNAQDVLFSPNRPDSIRSYFREVSYGVQDLDGEVMGPIPYAMGGRCDTDRLAKELLPQINGTFDQYLWFFGKQQAACNWAGIADLGRADRPTRHSWYNSFHSCTVLVQEPGHNFGMVHSSAMRCTRGGQPVPIAWPTQTGAQCSHVEYGNVFDPMGGGDCFHMNGVQKAYQDWLQGCNVIKATESGTFTIHPLESACDGPQLLQIPFPAPRAFSNAGTLTGYYLELRAPVGYRDRKLAPQVLVVVANDVREARLTGNNNWLLDMNPETASAEDAALPVGRRFEDDLPGGPRFTVISADATKAVIQVELQGKPAEAGRAGKAVCSDLSDYDATAPVKCVAPATAAPAPGADAGAAPGADAGAADARAGSGGSGGGGSGGAAGSGGATGGAGASGGGGRTGAGGSGGSAPPADPGPATGTGKARGGCMVAPVSARGAGPAALPFILWAAARRGRARRGSRRRR
jgi:hypothetical protein